MTSLKDKTVIITGASSGLGEAIALAMAEKGACLTLCGRDKDRLDAVIQKCSKFHNNLKDKLLAVIGDVTSSDCRKQIVEQTVQKFGQLDILILNAGVIFPGGKIETATEEHYDKLMDTNLKSIFFLIQEAMPFLQKSKGVIVCMSSVYGTLPTPTSTVYAFSKAALDHMVRCLALSLGPKGIRINAVKPSYVPTELTRNYPNHDELQSALSQKSNSVHPLEGRLCTPEEVAEVTIFLASSASSFVTGECVHVDGGRRFFPG